MHSSAALRLAFLMAKLCFGLLTFIMAVGIAQAKCNRGSLEQLKKDWTNVVTVYEADWVSYMQWLGCGLAAPATGGGSLSLCARDIFTRLAATELFKAAISHGAVDQTSIIDKIKTSRSFFVGGNEAAVKILTYQCKVCNCRLCLHGFNCDKCGEWCTAEPNRHALVLGWRSPSSGSGRVECHTIRNKCNSADFYSAFGFKVKGTDNWRTKGWWTVNRNSEIKLCFRRGTYLYAFFDWKDGKEASTSDVTFSVGDHGSFCVKSSRMDIIERPGSPKYLDQTTNSQANTCVGVGGEFKHFTVIDNGEYGASNVRSCPSKSFRSASSREFVEVTSSEVLNATLPDALAALALGEETFVVLEVDPKDHAYKQALQTNATQP